MNKYTFARDSFTVNGKTFPAEYHISPVGTVFLFVTVADGKEETVRITAEHEQYAAALEAAKPNQERAESIPTDDPKKTRGPVPDKTFIGDSIQGNGWKILFDKEAERTRVIFEGTPTDIARAILEEAGFYYSKAMNSWNKKLTFRAYRAAKAIAEKLNQSYAA